jgi:hypothetical protein
MARNTTTHCPCRVPVIDTVTPVFGTVAEGYAWLEANGVRDIGPDHLGRASITVADAMRLYEEAKVRSTIAEAARIEARAAHEAAVVELREAVAAAFIAETGGDAVISENGLVLTVAEKRAGQVDAGLEAARAVWFAAPFEVRVEVHQLDVVEGDTHMSYDLSTVLPRATVEDGVARAVRRANRAAAL